MITTLILDRGHATLDENCNYITPGKQFEFPDGLKVYEGFENQKYVEALASKAKQAGYNVEFTVLPNDPKDPSLHTRVLKANASKNRNTSIFISCHNNAGKGVGTEIFTSKGQTLSDKYAHNILKEYQKVLPNRKLRVDLADKDLDKEENFYVLKNTIMPAILIEFGFFDNRDDYNWLSNPEVINIIADATIEGINNTLIELYGKEAFDTRNF
jgi:N-acetylmuramoyl-L-alanine amidase